VTRPFLADPSEQLAGIRSKLDEVWDRSDYYREKFRRHGVEPRDFETLADLAKFPFFDKEEERQSQQESRERLGHSFGLHLTCDPSDVIRVSASSGTTGSPTYTPFTRGDKAWACENAARVFSRIGVQRGDRFAHASVLSMWIAGYPFAVAIEEYGACVVPIGVLTGVERFLAVARDLRPTTISATVSYVRHLGEKLRTQFDVDPSTLGVERLIVYGEPGGSIPEVYSALESTFGAVVYDLTGATGAHSPTAISCSEHNGMHFLAPDSCFIELVDPNTLEPLPIEDGVIGEVVYTGYQKEASPLIRWRDKDLVKVETTQCGCGHPEPRLWILGRTDDMIIVKGVNVYPSAIEDVLRSTSPALTGNVRIVLDHPGPAVEPPVRLRVELAASHAVDDNRGLKDLLEQRMHADLRFRSDVQLLTREEFGDGFGATHKSKRIERTFEQ